MGKVRQKQGMSRGSSVYEGGGRVLGKEQDSDVRPKNVKNVKVKPVPVQKLNQKGKGQRGQCGEGNLKQRGRGKGKGIKQGSESKAKCQMSS